MKKLLIGLTLLTSMTTFAGEKISFSGVDNKGKPCSIEIEGNGETLLAKVSYNKEVGELSMSENGSDYLEEFQIPVNSPVFHGMIGESDEYQGIQVHLLPEITNGSISGFSKFTYKDNTGFIRMFKPFKRVCSNLK